MRVEPAATAGPEAWVGTTVRFDLTAADDGGTLVRLDHTGWNDAEAMVREGTMGWAQMLQSLKANVESGKSAPFFDF